MRKRRRRKTSRWPQILILGGLALFIVAILAFKKGPADPPQTALLPEAQLAQALSNRQPTMVFFHSLDCTPCVQMMDTVDQVHPEFADSVVLVDVNVSDTRNHPLLRQQGIRVIPSLIFYDQSGQPDLLYGVIPPDSLRQRLQILLEPQL